MCLISRLEDLHYMRKILTAMSLGAALLAPTYLVAHDDHRDDKYYDRHHHDSHQWNANEDRAYHMYWEQNHRSYVDWDHASARQRQSYWDWRHNHSDALLKIDIR